MQASNSAVPLNLTNSIPKYMDLKSERQYSVLHGNTEFSRTVLTSSNLSKTNINMPCNPPEADTLVHPVAWKKAKWRLAISLTEGNVGNVTNVLGTPAAPLVVLRDHPLDKIIQNEELKINGQSFTVSTPYEFSEAFHRFANTVDDKVNEYSLTPSQMDEHFSYKAANLTAKSPFSQYGELQVGESRYAFGDVKYNNLDTGADTGIFTDAGAGQTHTQNTSKTYYIEFTVMEPIKISPMYYSQYALVGVKNMQYSANFANHERMICFKQALGTNVTLNSIVPELLEFELHFAYSTPKLLSGVPDSVVYPWNFIEYYPQDISTDVTSDTLDYSFRFNPIPLSGCPRKMIVWISEQGSEITGIGTTPLSLIQNMRKTDCSKTYLKNISISFNNKQGILAEADEKDLFEIAKKNGLLGLSYSQTVKWTGGYYCFNFGEEIPLPETLAPGTSSKPLLTFRGTFRRIPGIAAVDADIVPTKFKLNTALIYDGTVVIVKNSTALQQLSVLSPEDVADSLESGYETIYPDRYRDNKFGGNPALILGALSSALPIARMIRGVVQKGAPIAKMIADGAEKIGLGTGGELIVNTKAKGKKKAAGKISGGELITRSQLSNEMY